jgi:hypothetical protein
MTTRWKARWRWPTMFRQRGAQVWVAAPGQKGKGSLPVMAGLPALCTPLLIIQSFYRATSRAVTAPRFQPRRAAASQQGDRDGLSF